MDFNITDSCNLIDKILQLISENDNKEHCAIAVADVKESGKVLHYDINDYCMVEDVGGSTKKMLSTVPAKVSYVLLNSCMGNGYVPVIIHTHPFCSNRVSFSSQDMIFIEKFTQEAKNRGLKFSMFIVTDGLDIVYCMRNLDSMEYIYKEERLNEPHC